MNPYTDYGYRRSWSPPPKPAPPKSIAVDYFVVNPSLADFSFADCRDHAFTHASHIDRSAVIEYRNGQYRYWLIGRGEAV
jgi:hypothetical protein